MIHIRKGDAPAILLSRGVEAAKRHCEDYEADRDAYNQGKKRLEFKSSIYGHQTVRDALEESHYGKCAYCEVRIPKPYADGHVEHWRPKGAVKQARGTENICPGYYWLAYDWDNLLLACQFCNRDNKRTLFPLNDPSLRARNHLQLLAAESPQILKPDGTDFLGEHIEFVDELPRGRTPLGRTTIETLGLDRIEHKPRDDLYIRLKEAYDIVTKFVNDPHEAACQIVAAERAFLQQAPLPSSPFSAMAAAFIESHPVPPS